MPLPKILDSDYRTKLLNQSGIKFTSIEFSRKIKSGWVVRNALTFAPLFVKKKWKKKYDFLRVD